ncbi:MAG: AAA family ATPase, partial [Bacilli bacterium]|nr:AAA family ATPase [Bacilli bacterium]
QKEIIKKGINMNLIVTGGPGTGKTSSVLFTLIALLEKDLNKYKNIYMTAPSGKPQVELRKVSKQIWIYLMMTIVYLIQAYSKKSNKLKNPLFIKCLEQIKTDHLNIIKTINCQITPSLLSMKQV